KTNVPTFVLQPIIENSIIHGLAKKEEGGYIRIHVFTALNENEEKMLSVVVSDTGAGIATEKLAQIRSELSNEGVERNTIGISNIYGRLKLVYENAGFEIDSIEGEGTVVRFTIPLRSEGAT
ncbi:MAG: two-component sensor histidine kinase, partial [Lachnospiraceae bacterium]|nr:two-component sensor histidine kinase [Lachnospiraceae bacterium]